MALYLGNQKIGGLNVFNDYPNIDITTETPTTINGLLKGNGSTVQVAERGVDYVHPSDLAYSLPTASSSTLGGVKIGSNLSISNGVLSVPTASGTKAGVCIVYPAASCTTFTSDSGTITPLAAQKAAKMFAITRPDSTTNKAIVRYSNTTGDVQDSDIIIEDVTNSRDNSAAQVIAIPASGGKKMVYGYCTDQIDGTSFIGGVFDASATSYPYTEGLAIGGSSGNLLWKGSKVLSAADNNAISTVATSNLTASRALVSNSSGKIAVSAVTSTELGYLDGVTSNVQTQLNNKQDKIAVSGILKSNGSTVSAAVAGTDYAIPPKAVTVTLPAAGWDADALTQTVTVEGATATNIKVVSPAYASVDEYAACGVKAAAEGAGTITFTCTIVPENDLTVNIAILG